MSSIIPSNHCPNCKGVIFSFDFDKEKNKYRCKTCGCEFEPQEPVNDADLDPKDRIGGFMNQSAAELHPAMLQGEQTVVNENKVSDSRPADNELKDEGNDESFKEVKKALILFFTVMGFLNLLAALISTNNPANFVFFAIGTLVFYGLEIFIRRIQIAAKKGDIV